MCSVDNIYKIVYFISNAKTSWNYFRDSLILDDDNNTNKSKNKNNKNTRTNNNDTVSASKHYGLKSTYIFLDCKVPLPLTNSHNINISTNEITFYT